MVTTRWARAVVACIVSGGVVLTSAPAFADWTPGGPRFWVDSPSAWRSTRRTGACGSSTTRRSAPTSSTPTADQLDSLGGFGIGPGQFNGFSGLAIGPNGDVYGSDIGNHRIQRFTPDGDYAAVVRQRQPSRRSPPASPSPPTGRSTRATSRTACTRSRPTEPRSRLPGGGDAAAPSRSPSATTAPLGERDRGSGPRATACTRSTPRPAPSSSTIGGFGQPIDIEVGPRRPGVGRQLQHVDDPDLRARRHVRRGVGGDPRHQPDRHRRLRPVVPLRPRRPGVIDDAPGPGGDDVVHRRRTTRRPSKPASPRRRPGRRRSSSTSTATASTTWPRTRTRRSRRTTMPPRAYPARARRPQRRHPAVDQQPADRRVAAGVQPALRRALLVRARRAGGQLRALPQRRRGVGPMATVHLADGRREFVAIPRSLGFGGARFVGVTAADDVITRSTSTPSATSTSSTTWSSAGSRSATSWRRRSRSTRAARRRHVQPPAAGDGVVRTAPTTAGPDSSRATGQSRRGAPSTHRRRGPSRSSSPRPTGPATAPRPPRRTPSCRIRSSASPASPRPPAPRAAAPPP